MTYEQRHEVVEKLNLVEIWESMHSRHREQNQSPCTCLSYLQFNRVQVARWTECGTVSWKVSQEVKKRALRERWLSLWVKWRPVEAIEWRRGMVWLAFLQENPGLCVGILNGTRAMAGTLVARLLQLWSLVLVGGDQICWPIENGVSMRGRKESRMTPQSP